jgi:hypothetical protein
MTTKRISALPSLSTVQASTVFAVVDGGTTQKVTASVVKAYIGDPPSLINNGHTVALDTAGNLTLSTTLTFPDTTVQSTAWRGLVNADTQTLGGALRVNNYPLYGGSYDGNQLNLTTGSGADISSLRDGAVYIKTGTDGTVSSSWEFGSNGNLTLPEGATGTTKFTRITGGDSFLNLDVQYESLDDVYNGSRIGTNGANPFDIVTDFNGGHHTWRFDSNGNIQLPNGTNTIGSVQGPGLEIYSNSTLRGGEESYYVQMNWNNSQRIGVNADGAFVTTNDGVHSDRNWYFQPNGDLSLAYGDNGNLIGLDYGYICQNYVGGFEPLVISGGEEVEIRTDEDGYKFTFGRDGVLTLAAPAVIAGADYNNAVHIATRSDNRTYGFNQSYWSALNGNALRINTGSGNAQDFACTVSLNVNGTYSITVANSGNSFVPGNWFTIPGTELGGLIGVPPAGNDLKITVATVDGGGAILTTTLLGTNGSKEWTFGVDGTITFPDGTIQQSAAFNGISVSTTETATNQKIATFSGTTGKTFTGSVNDANDWNWLSWVDDLPFFTDLPNNGVRGGKISALVTVRGTQGGTDFDDYVEYVFSANYGPYDTNANCLLAGTNHIGNMTHFVAANALGVWTRFDPTPATAQNFTVEITYTATLFFGQENVWC